MVLGLCPECYTLKIAICCLDKGYTLTLAVVVDSAQKLDLFGARAPERGIINDKHLLPVGAGQAVYQRRHFRGYQK